MAQLVFHIGLHKTGTTWLQSGYFKDHPDIHLLSNSVRPWEDRLLSYLIQTSEARFDINRCRQILETRVSDLNGPPRAVHLVSAERLSGHPFSGAYDRLTLAHRIHECFPDARILLAIRNPIDMIISIYRQLVREGYPGKLADLIRGSQWKSAQFSVDVYEYGHLIEQYYKCFGFGNVLLLRYEDLRQDRRAFVDNIADFLGIDRVAPSNLESRSNPGLPDAQVASLRALNYFRKTELNPFPIVHFPYKLLRALSVVMSPLFARSKVATQNDIDVIKASFKNSEAKLNAYLKDHGLHPISYGDSQADKELSALSVGLQAAPAASEIGDSSDQANMGV